MEVAKEEENRGRDGTQQERQEEPDQSASALGLRQARINQGERAPSRIPFAVHGHVLMTAGRPPRYVDPAGNPSIRSPVSCTGFDGAGRPRDPAPGAASRSTPGSSP